MTVDVDALRARLESCPPGQPGWSEFEKVGVEILKYLFVPPLIEPIIQPRSFSGIDRRDAVFPNRSEPGDGNWGLLYRELEARMILVEFKNYSSFGFLGSAGA